ncbi:MAG: FKBP-type peptidyl-prolyl cis-trans isomerase [Bacteroidota bacterium]
MLSFKFHSPFLQGLLLLTVLVLASCSKKGPQFKETISGYKYLHHTKNKGPKPKVGDEVSYHEIVFRNDTLVQSTYYYGDPRRIVLPSPDSVAKPPRPDYEALFLMAVGDSLTVYQPLKGFKPSELPRGVSVKDTFIYHVKLFGIRDKAAVEKEAQALLARRQSIADSTMNYIKAFQSGALKDALQTTESGLQYILHRPGTGAEAKSGKFIDVHYSGFLMDGTNFDETYSKAAPYTFRLDRGLVIKGWDEGLQLLKEGGQATFFVPYTLAYGEAGRPGTIPERADLVFYVELKNVRFAD